MKSKFSRMCPACQARAVQVIREQLVPSDSGQHEFVTRSYQCKRCSFKWNFTTRK